ncbi:MAG: MBL fold metallo-hydrolase [Acidobacteria bacterium]|nr:MAG: MBL fold metallo-hydrolase [Acidobacteriota bacterium]
MKTTISIGLALSVVGATVLAQTVPNTVDAHIAAAKAAAGSEHTNTFNSLCMATEERASSNPAPRANATPPPPPDRAKWHVEPMKVFDNLYYLGQSEYSAWAVTTSAGIIVIDTLFDYSVEDEIVNGLTKLGLDPKNIKYVIVSHAHSDHEGGARLLQDRFGAHVLMSQADWDLTARITQSWPKPRKDMVVTDGQKLTLGDTTLTMYLTPGHTPGTISTIIPVRDNGRPHVAAEWGGTGFNFTVSPDKPRRYWYETYAASADHFRDAVKKAGADVLIANHPEQDGAKAKLAALATRKAGAPNPYVIGNDSVVRYVTMVGECARASLLRFSAATK